MDIPEDAAAIDEAEAVEIARRAVAGRITLTEGGPVTVDAVGDAYVVTFKYEAPPDVLGPDYDAQVTLERATGKVLKILAGS
jgi:hypothetical protein